MTVDAKEMTERVDANKSVSIRPGIDAEECAVDTIERRCEGA